MQMAYIRPWTSLQLCFHAPWHVGLAKLSKDFIGAHCVEVFGINQQTVHVEETAAT